MNPHNEQHVSGSIERIISKSEESGWAVIEVMTEGKPATVVGSLAHVDEGLRIEAEGRWNQHRNFGWQFKASSVRVYPPVGREGIERFLRSGAVDGIGPVFASKIVSTFGDNTLKVIEREQWRLKRLKGVGPKRIKAVVDGVKKYRTRMEVMSFLHGKLGPVRAQRVYDKYGDEARETIAKNPYRLIDDFDGVGFALADQVARDVGVEVTHPMRQTAAILTVLKQASSQGHTCVAMTDCEQRVIELLESEELGKAAMQKAGTGVDWKTVSRKGVAGLELNRFEFLDGRIVARLGELVAAKPTVPTIDASKAIPWAEQRVGLTLEAGQRAAVETALRERVSIITGGPGVGKTTILKALIQILKAKKLRVSLAAPTGRAARRMSEATGEPADTIHKLLEWSPVVSGFTRKRETPLETDVVIIDETSMVDISLARSLLEAVPNGAKLVWVGDKDQLPSVGPGQFLADVIESGVIPVAALTKPFRQVGDSPIIRNAHLVNAGIVPELDVPEPEFAFVETKTAEETAEALIETVCRTLPAAGVDIRNDLIVMIPMHGGTVGVKSINRELQSRINGNPAEQITRGDTRYGVGDKVLQTRNNRDLQVFNGDTGVIEGISQKDKVMKVRFDQQRVEYPFSDLSGLSLAYCQTVHKCQGNESPCVVIAVDRSNSILLNRKLLYTAITRAKQRVVLIGQKRAVHLAVSESRAMARSTMLRQRLTTDSETRSSGEKSHIH